VLKAILKRANNLFRSNRIEENGSTTGIPSQPQLNPMDRADFSEIIKAIQSAEEIVVFTGAGISADSGIPTFRDGATGLWNNIDPDEVASIRGFEVEPERVWAWHAQLKALVDSCQPNSGHFSISEFETRLSDKRITVITQNIDGYHRSAGSSRVYEIHGSIHRLRCHRNCSYFATWEQSDHHPVVCPNCGAQARPDVVWFGEALNEDLLGFAEAAARNADVFIAVGTSASVHPAAGLPIMAKLAGALVIEVNPHVTAFSEHADYFIRLNAGQFFTAVLDSM
jgi:NAD-dependent deacetylase